MAHAALTCIVPDGTVPTDGSLTRVAAEQPLSWPVGDGGTIVATCYGEDGAIYDLVGCTITLVCREHAADAAYLLAYAGVIDDTPPGGTAPGTATFTLLSGDTEHLVAGKVYWFDVRLTTAGLGGSTYHVIPPSKLTPTFTIARASEPPADPAP